MPVMTQNCSPVTSLTTASRRRHRQGGSFTCGPNRTPPTSDRLRFEACLRTAEHVDRGNKTLATKLHPDHGGSGEEMQDLNAAKTRLKRMM
jgi:hypothetical protein